MTLTGWLPRSRRAPLISRGNTTPIICWGDAWPIARFDDARRSYKKVIRSAAGSKTETAAKAQWMIAESYFYEKNYDAAAREYLRLETLSADRAWQAAALLEAAKCRELLGETGVAAELDRRVLKLDPKSAWAGQARERLEKLEKAANSPPSPERP